MRSARSVSVMVATLSARTGAADGERAFGGETEAPRDVDGGETRDETGRESFGQQHRKQVLHACDPAPHAKEIRVRL